MARELVLGALKTHFLGVSTLETGTGKNDSRPADNRILRSAWLSILNTVQKALYGAILIRVGAPGVLGDGVFLKEGWFGSGWDVPSDDQPVHAEGISWHGALPLFDHRAIRIVFSVRNDSGTTVEYVGGYAWEEFESNDRPS